MHDQVLVSNYNYLGTIIDECGKIGEEINKKTSKAGRLYISLKNTFLAKKEKKN